MASSDGRKKSGILTWVGRKMSRDEKEEGLGDGGKINGEELELKEEGGKENYKNEEKNDESEGQVEEEVKNTGAGEKPGEWEERMASSDGRKRSGILSWVGRKLSRDEGEDGLREAGKKEEGKEKKEEEGKATGATGDPEVRTGSSTGRKKSGLLSWVGRKLSRDEGEVSGKEDEVEATGGDVKEAEGYEEQRAWRGGPHGAREVTEELRIAEERLNRCYLYRVIMPFISRPLSVMSLACVGIDLSADEKGR